MSVSLITPAQIRAKATRYYGQFLQCWISGESDGFFPLPLPTRLKLSAQEFAKAIQGIEVLRAASKETRGVGYTLHWERRQMRRYGSNPLPRLSIDTSEDLLELAGRRDEFARIQLVVQRVRAEFPESVEMEAWLRKNVRNLAAFAEPLDGLIAVVRYLRANPWPDCYARQLPVDVDTKFVEQHRSVLQQWLDLLLPCWAVRSDEPNFFRRFGFRDGQQHWAIRVLDPRLQQALRLPFDELSLPLRSLVQLPVQNATVVIVENRTNLMTLPPIARGLGLRGEGRAVALLRDLDWLGDDQWLRQNRIFYWGDLDVEGFDILSNLRVRFPQIRSLLMDSRTLEDYRRFAVPHQAASPPPPRLTAEEAVAFELCRCKHLRLEQEKIPQPAVESALAAAGVEPAAQPPSGEADAGP